MIDADYITECMKEYYKSKIIKDLNNKPLGMIYYIPEPPASIFKRFVKTTRYKYWRFRIWLASFIAGWDIEEP